jgi:uncharacterized protein (DUF1778 family)
MAAKIDRRLREERLGFRVDEPTKALIERAAQADGFLHDRANGRCPADDCAA